MKKLLILIYFIFVSINAEVASPSNTFKGIFYRPTASSVIMNAASVSHSVSIGQAENLVGDGSNKMWIGDLIMVIYSSTSSLPHQLELQSSTYDSSNLIYVAYNGTRKLEIGVYRDFSSTGTETEFTYIDPTTNPITLRSSNSTIMETHKLRFYIMQNSINSFISGTYTASFTLFFYTS